MITSQNTSKRYMKPLENKCTECELTFDSKDRINEHMKMEHNNEDEWNCNDCDFQGSSSFTLMNHLKLTRHQPSERNTARKISIFKCNSCEKEFQRYVALMLHRKTEHKSRVCRYFKNKTCNFSKDECWYRHTEESPIDIDEKYSCNHCELEFESMGAIMKHKKQVHKSSKLCRNFMEGGCKRTEEQCWYLHSSNKQTTDMDFQSAPRYLPPDKLENILMDLVNKVSQMEKLVSQFNLKA